MRSIVVAAAVVASVLLSTAAVGQVYPVTGSAGSPAKKASVKPRTAETVSTNKTPIVLNQQQTKAYNDREIARAQLAAIEIRHAALSSEFSRVSSVLSKYSLANIKDPGLENKLRVIRAQIDDLTKQSHLLKAKIASCEYALPSQLVKPPAASTRRR